MAEFLDLAVPAGFGGLTGRTSKVCQVWFNPGPSSSGPAGKEARGRLTVTAGAQPGPQPEALTPSTLVTAGWQHTHFPKVDASSSCKK